jgi:regulator of CtrA degradation
VALLCRTPAVRLDKAVVPLLNSPELNCGWRGATVAAWRGKGLSADGMSEPANINPRIIESLYGEALVLSDEVRAAFMLSGRIENAGRDEDLARIALSCEALRTTTRMMHAIAWLLNHRAYFMGELSEFQLRRHGRLTRDAAAADPERMALLEPHVRDLIAASERFYARLMRLDNGWRQRDPEAPSAIATLRERLRVAGQ